MIADFGDCLVLNAAAVERAEFANNIVIANFKISTLTVIFQILGDFTYRGKLINAVFAADFRRAVDDDVRTYPGGITNFYISADDRVRANMYIFANLGGWVDYGGVMYHCEPLESFKC